MKNRWILRNGFFGFTYKNSYTTCTNSDRKKDFKQRITRYPIGLYSTALRRQTHSSPKKVNQLVSIIYTTMWNILQIQGLEHEKALVMVQLGNRWSIDLSIFLSATFRYKSFQWVRRRTNFWKVQSLERWECVENYSQELMAIYRILSTVNWT